MDNSRPTTQRLLFESGGPRWRALPEEMQPQLIEVLSQVLLDTLQRRGNTSIIAEITTEDDHES
jgi:hypothetical protein